MTKRAMRYASALDLLTLLKHVEARGVSVEAVADASVIALVRGRIGERVPAWFHIDALERCAAVFEDPLFGLRYGQQVDPKIYGPLSLLWRYAPTVRYSNRVTMRILHLQHEGLNVAVREDDDITSLLYRIDAEPGREHRQFIEAGVSFMLCVCRLIMGKAWRPLRVEFAHAPIDDVARYAEIVDAPVRFGAADNGIVFAPGDFDRRSADHNAEILAFVEQSLLRVAEQDPLPFRERLDQVVDDLIAIHKPRLTAAAAAMAMSSRTLQRHLTAEGLCFREVVRERRRLIIDSWRQRSPKPSLALLAERTALSEASAVSRFLRTDAKQRVEAPV